MIDGLPLSDLLSRSLHLQWFEGVAIVRAVAETLLGDHSTSTPFIPELQDIELRADGCVVLGSGTTGDDPVRRLGQLLQTMLTDAELSVQLRLIVAQATAPSPSYSSVAEFDQAVAYFERPKRAELLVALFARAVAAGPAPDGAIALTLDLISPLPPAMVTLAAAEHHPPRARWRLGIAAALVGVVALATAAVVYARRGSPTLNGATVSGVVTGAADVVGAAVLKGISAVSDSAGLGRIVAADTVNAPSSAGGDLPSLPQRLPKAAGPADVRPESVPSGRAVIYETADSAPANEIPVPETAPTEASGGLPPDSTLYEPGATGVAPPVGFGSQLPRRLLPSIHPDDLSQIELIIGRDGSVESARLLGDRRDVRGGMLLSAAKAWRFKPAMKEGVAVRYRKRVLVSFE